MDNEFEAVCAVLLFAVFYIYAGFVWELITI